MYHLGAKLLTLSGDRVDLDMEDNVFSQRKVCSVVFDVLVHVLMVRVVRNVVRKWKIGEAVVLLRHIAKHQDKN